MKTVAASRWKHLLAVEQFYFERHVRQGEQQLWQTAILLASANERSNPPVSLKGKSASSSNNGQSGQRNSALRQSKEILEQQIWRQAKFFSRD